MRTIKKILLTSLFSCGAICTSIAQVTEPTNYISSSSSYVGTAKDYDVLFKRQNVNAGSLTTTTTTFGLDSFAPDNINGGTSIGVGAGQYTEGGSNTLVGNLAGSGIDEDHHSGIKYNCYFGSSAGAYSNGTNNVGIGDGSGTGSSGDNNVFAGVNAGLQSNGQNNILIGIQVGQNLTGSNNLIMGQNFNQIALTCENKLIIENGWDDVSPLIWGDFEENQLKFNAKVGIGYEFGNYPVMAGGVNVSDYNLFVKGGILTEAVRVNLESNWADYVFNKDYNLKSLSEVEKFINENGHLPNVPSATQVKEDGIELGEMAKIQQEKIEELTLYIIALNKKLEAQDKKIELLMQTKQ